MLNKFVVYDASTKETRIEDVEIEDITQEPPIPQPPTTEERVQSIEKLNVDIIATTFDMDYRLLEVEWALEDAGITGVLNILNEKGVNNMALSRYEQAKIMILGGAYEKETLTRQLTRYLEKKVITQQEYDDLIALMNAQELVQGE